MSSKKIITVTPELFNVSGKTRKKREKKEIAFNPIISPSTLKSKLLKRIKEHKIGSDSNSSAPPKQETTFSDEFYSAVNYLSDLNKKQKQQKALHNRTVRNYSSPTINSSINSNISLDLPQVFNEQIIPTTNEQIQVNYKTVDNVPYGCLKGGKKKTYRQWQEELKIQETPGLADVMVARPPTPPKIRTEEKNISNIFDNVIKDNNINESVTLNNGQLTKEQRLENIKNKLRQIQDNEDYKKEQALKELNLIEKKMGFVEPNISDIPDIDDPIKQNDIDSYIELKKKERNNKNYIKKTYKRKFTLGKSDKLRKVSILLKDKKTRKNIIDTQKELKKVHINDVKRYLRQHGIIKTGSICPPDILRKMYESALMAGDIRNTNKENLLHNFLHEEPNN